MWRHKDLFSASLLFLLEPGFINSNLVNSHRCTRTPSAQKEPHNDPACQNYMLDLSHVRMTQPDIKSFFLFFFPQAHNRTASVWPRHPLKLWTLIWRRQVPWGAYVSSWSSWDDHWWNYTTFLLVRYIKWLKLCIWYLREWIPSWPWNGFRLNFTS